MIFATGVCRLPWMDVQDTDITLPGPKTFRRGLQILEVLRTAGSDGLRIPDIAARAGIQRCSVYRFLDVLLEMGYVRELPEQRVFVVATDLFCEVASVNPRIERLKPIMQRISAECGDSTFLIHRDAGDSLCIHREVGTYPVQVRAVSVGHRQPLGVGAAGLALLASLPDGDAMTIIGSNAGQLPRFGGMSPERLQCLVRSTRERGWSVVANAAVPGVLGVGLPVPNRAGRPEFAISLSSVTERMPPARQRMVIATIRRHLRTLE